MSAILPRMVIAEGFVHRPGKHCGSTALSDFFSAQGMLLDEVDAIGLGGAPAGAVMSLPGLSPSHYFLPRNPSLETDAFAALGIPFKWRAYKDQKQAQDELLGTIAAGRPVLLQTDIRYLAHYNTKTHFNGHVVVAAAYDLDAGVVMLADTQFEELQPVALEDLEKARFSKAPPLPLQGNAFFFEEAPDLPERPDAEHHRRGLAQWIAHRQGKTAMKGMMSLEAMAHLVNAMPSFAEAEDAGWIARWTYQVTEKRGTGGGAFRRLFADYLLRLGETNAAVNTAGEKMSESAGWWTDMAHLLRAASEDPSKAAFEEGALILAKALDCERSAVAALEAALPTIA